MLYSLTFFKITEQETQDYIEFTKASLSFLHQPEKQQQHAQRNYASYHPESQEKNEFVLNVYFLGFLTYIKPTVEMYTIGKAIFKLTYVQSILTPILRISEGLQKHLALGYPSIGRRILPKEKLYSNYHHPGILETMHMIIKNV